VSQGPDPGHPYFRQDDGRQPAKTTAVLINRFTFATPRRVQGALRRLAASAGSLRQGGTLTTPLHSFYPILLQNLILLQMLQMQGTIFTGE